LTITRVDNNVRLSWPTGTGFQLQTADSLAPANWTDVGVAPQVNGGQNVLTLSAPGRVQFYRLRSP
jgi:hypothetical protein